MFGSEIPEMLNYKRIIIKIKKILKLNFYRYLWYKKLAKNNLAAILKNGEQLNIWFLTAGEKKIKSPF